MKALLDMKRRLDEDLTAVERELWKLWTQATDSKDLDSIDRIRSALEIRKNVEAEVLRMFSSLERLGGPVQNTSQSQTKNKAVKDYPKLLRIGEHAYPVRFLNQVPVLIANWILEKGRSLPEIPNFIHKQKKGFMASASLKTLSNGWYIEVGDSKQTLISKGRKLLDHTGFSSIRFSVEMHNGEIIGG
jgi:hypothetical protein